MHHFVRITFGKVQNLPYHGACSCGVAGDFKTNEEVRNYFANHLARIQGVNSAEFVDETTVLSSVPTPEPEPEPAPAPAPAPASEPSPEPTPEPVVEPPAAAEAAG